jgi:integrase
MSKKRGQGEGSIFEESPGRWVAVMNLGYEVRDGKRRRLRKKFIGSTRQAAAERLNEALAKHQRGGIVTTGRDTLGDFLQNWLEASKNGVRPKTYRSYEQMLRNHIVKAAPIQEWTEKHLDSVPGLAAMELRKLDPTHIERWMAAKIKAGNSPALVKYLRVVLRIALNEAVRRGIIDRNAAALAKPPIAPKSTTVTSKGFTQEESARLFAATKEHRLEALFMVCAHGLRHSEALGLRWQDVDLDRSELHVSYQLQRVEKKAVLVELKSDESRRFVPLSDVCVELLRRQRQRQTQEREFAGDDWQEGGFVFTSQRGTPLFDRNVLRAFHGIRHACVSLLAAAGVPDKVIAEIVGHSDVRLTKNIYSHPDREQKRSAIAKLGEVLGPVAPQLAPSKAKPLVN